MSEEDSKKVFYVHASMLGDLYFDIFEMEKETAKSIFCKHTHYRTLKKTDPGVFLDGLKAAEYFLQKAEEQKAKLVKKIERIDKLKTKVLAAVEERRERDREAAKNNG